MPDKKPVCYRNPNEENELKSYHLCIDYKWYELKVGFEEGETVVKWYEKRGHRRFGLAPDGWVKVDEPIRVQGVAVIPRGE